MIILNKVIFFGALIFSSCSSINKAELSSGSPKAAIVEVEELRDYIVDSQFDLLGNDQFENGVRRLEYAKEGIVNNDESEYILEKLSQAKGYFLETERIAESNAFVPDRILQARKAALDNGVKENHLLREELENLDNSLRNETNDFTLELGVKNLSSFERSYLGLEVKSVQNKKLSIVRNVIKSSEKNNSIQIAPETYRKASVSLNAAENMIEQSPRNPENYERSVQESTNSAKLLSDVMVKLNGAAKGASEKTALEMVYQERKLGVMSDRAKVLQSSLERSQSDLGAVTSDYVSLKNKASNTEDKLVLQAAIDDVRKNFNYEEAEVYQQGDDLIIRLKNINFKSGSFSVPSQSMNLLSKINAVVVKLRSPRIIVEGHTDSTGNKNNNTALSLKRSKAVARYLSSIGNSYQISSKGYGESHPIANNQTRDGRAINRRVDIVVNTNHKL